MDNTEKVALLIRVAKQMREGTDKQSILSWAEELISKAYVPQQNIKTQDVEYPILVFARHQDNKYEGMLTKGWKIERNGNLPASPSKAAVDITGYPVNGWRFWRYTNKDGQERLIDDFRSKMK